MHYAVYNQSNSWPLATQTVSPWFKQNGPLRCSMQSHCENCRGRNGGHTPGMDGAGCHPPFSQALHTCNDLYSHCREEHPAGPQADLSSAPRLVQLVKEPPPCAQAPLQGGKKVEQLFIWLEAAPFAWIQPP